MTSVRFKLSVFRLLSGATLASALLTPVASRGQDQSTAPTKTSPDNSANNKAQNNTADQQSEASSDRMLTKKIRQALIADKSLSTYGHNVKIITKDGFVTLKGPVHSEEEKQSIASKTESIVGSPDKVTNQLTVKQ
jgi:hyperosmotically inducible protein